MIELKLGNQVLAMLPEAVAKKLVALSDQTPGYLLNLDLSMRDQKSKRSFLEETSLYHVDTMVNITAKLELVFFKRHIGQTLYDQREEKR